MRHSLTSTPVRTFLLVPALAITEEIVRRRRPDVRWLPALAWGYCQYKVVGTNRVQRAGGPPGMSQGFPDRLITDGIYAHTRNPMYLGHLVFLGGLAATTRSPVAIGYFAWALPWFNRRASRDEDRLLERFGAEYEQYRRRVPRWIPRVSRRRSF